MSNRFKINVISMEGVRAGKLAESWLTDNSKMIEAVKDKTFKYDSGTGLHVAETLLLDRPTIGVYSYRPKYKNSAAIGYFDGKNIYWNVYKLEQMGEIELAANLVHEWSHYCGFHHRDPGIFGGVRENYWTPHKSEFSVPYFLSDNAKRWL